MELDLGGFEQRECPYRVIAFGMQHFFGQDYGGS